MDDQTYEAIKNEIRELSPDDTRLIVGFFTSSHWSQFKSLLVMKSVSDAMLDIYQDMLEEFADRWSKESQQ